MAVCEKMARISAPFLFPVGNKLPDKTGIMPARCQNRGGRPHPAANLRQAATGVT
jgi:hypothetical protein